MQSSTGVILNMVHQSLNETATLDLRVFRCYDSMPLVGHISHFKQDQCIICITEKEEKNNKNLIKNKSDFLMYFLWHKCMHYCHICQVWDVNINKTTYIIHQMKGKNEEILMINNSDFLMQFSLFYLCKNKIFLIYIRILRKILTFKCYIIYILKAIT